MTSDPKLAEPVDTDGPSYYGEVETYFVERRGAPLFITPAEWGLVAKWEEQGIPVHVVQEGIDRVFERPQAASKPRKLGYCRQTVEAAFRRFREVSFGGRREGGKDRAPADDRVDVNAHLSSLAAELQDLAPELAAQVEQLASSGANLNAMEEALTRVDEQLLDTAEETMQGDERETLLGKAARSLEAYRDRMPEKVYRSALKSAYRRRLRARAKLPRLSLFDR